MILLSIFDGIGCSRLAVEAIAGKVDFHVAGYLAWEIDEACKALTSQAFQAEHRGDFSSDNPEDVAARIAEIDPDQEAVILMCAGPPCPDYSRITEGPGKEGTEGIKFEIFAKWQRNLIPHLGRRRVAKLTENVIPHRRGDIQYFDDKLGYPAILFDAAEFKRISRPRVWWSSINWDDESVQTVLGQSVSWKRHFGTYKLVCPQPTTAVHVPDGWSPPRCWQNGELLPCLTTPAPTEAGRAAPRSAKGRMDSATYGRWINDNRQYAPWHYHEASLMTNQDNQLRTPPIETKESLHHIPVGHTASLGDRQRHKAVANSWHVGVASLLIWILILQNMATKAATTACWTRPMAFTSFPASDVTASQWVQNYPPGAGQQARHESYQLEDITDTWAHSHRALRLPDPGHESMVLEAQLQMTLFHRQALKDNLHTLRPRVCHDMRTLVSHTADTNIQVIALRTPAAALTVRLNWRDPVLLPEMETGFPLWGPFEPGWGWPSIQDGRHLAPTSKDTLPKSNLAYTKERLHRCDPHWETLLPEIEPDLETGRRQGPCHSPPEWAQETAVSPQLEHTQQLLPGPSGHHLTITTFSILPTGAAGRTKIRSGEVWRRGSQNTTIQVIDASVDHWAETCVAKAHYRAQRHTQSKTWGTDQDDAYKPLPVVDLAEDWVILLTASGVTLRRHQALLLRATGAVWAYGRKDTLMQNDIKQDETIATMIYLPQNLIKFCSSTPAMLHADAYWRQGCSSANFSDRISQQDESILSAQGWTKIKIDWEPLYEGMAECTSSLHYALHSHEKLQSLSSNRCEDMGRSSRTTMVRRNGTAPTKPLPQCDLPAAHHPKRGVPHAAQREQ